jgi:plastocyanin
VIALSLIVALAATDAPPAMATHAAPDSKADSGPDYLPSGPAAAFLDVHRSGQRGGAPVRKLVIMTERVAVNETGPKETVERFGETYAFSPSFLAVHAGEPVEISFWNLQPDDLHDVLFVAPDHTALMHWKLPALSKVTFTYTFKKAGLYDMICTMHAAEMTGQILVLP